LESGPAAGVVATLAVARQLGHEQVIAFDMGGTTAKASLIENGDVSRGREYEAGGSLSVGSRLLRGSGELLRIPTIDIAEVGAGGGSIAWIDPAGGFQVGPRSAGADPGPACYGRGAVAPTVTDANVVLGYMPTGPIADGEISLSPELAVDAMQDIAESLSMSATEAALGVHKLANARMMRALRAVSSERGRDPRQFAIVAYGGSGPVHAAGLASELGVRTVIIPPLAGFFSAVGLLFARQEFHDVRTCQLDAHDVDPAELTAIFDDLKTVQSEHLRAAEDVEWIRTADLRYKGQSWEIEVELPPGELSREALQTLVESFEQEHELLYGLRGEPGTPVDIRAVRLGAIGPVRADQTVTPSIESIAERGSSRLTHFESGSFDSAVLSRNAVPAEPMSGPLLVDEYDTTVVVPPGWTIRRDTRNNVLILEAQEGTVG